MNRLLTRKFLLGFLSLLFSACHSQPINSEAAKNYPLELVRVSGKMFIWQVTHAGPDGQLDTPDDIKTENLIVVPKHRNLKLILESEDVSHGFFLPAFGIRRSLLPQKKMEVEIALEKSGQHRFACSEVCGVGHGKMLGSLMILEQADYQKWLDNLTRDLSHVTSSAF